jgi:hypothetical protein
VVLADRLEHRHLKLIELRLQAGFRADGLLGLVVLETDVWGQLLELLPKFALRLLLHGLQLRLELPGPLPVLLRLLLEGADASAQDLHLAGERGVGFGWGANCGRERRWRRERAGRRKSRKHCLLWWRRR